MKIPRINYKCAVYCKIVSFEDGVDFINYLALSLLRNEKLKKYLWIDLDGLGSHLPKDELQNYVRGLENHKYVAICRGCPNDFKYDQAMEIHDMSYDHYTNRWIGNIIIEDPEGSEEMYDFTVYDVNSAECITSSSFSGNGSSFIYEDSEIEHEDIILRLFVWLDKDGNEVHDDIYTRFMELEDI